MQFLYRLGAVLLTLIAFPFFWFWGTAVVVAMSTHPPTEARATIDGAIIAAGLTFIVVRVWRWVCGQDDRRPYWMKYPCTPLEKRISDFVRQHAHKARPLDVSHLPSVRDKYLRREPRLINRDEV